MNPERRAVTFWPLLLLLGITDNSAIGDGKPNILFTQGDNIGTLRPATYQRGPIVEEGEHIFLHNRKQIKHAGGSR